jgi:hypothetical protein
MFSIRRSLTLVSFVLVAVGSAPAVHAQSAATASAPIVDCGCPARVDPARFVHATVSSNGETVFLADGLPYIAAHLGAPAAADQQTYPMAALAKLAVSRHAGLAIYDPATSTAFPVWRFSLGAVSLIARDIWVRRVTGAAPVPLPGDRVLVRTPNAGELPAELRMAIDRYMRENDGVPTPKIALVSVASSPAAGDTTVMLVPNLPPASFGTSAAWRQAVRRLAWFIPGNERIEPPPADPARFNATFSDIAPVAQSAE